MIIADISSNTVCILVEDGKIKGAMDACVGAMGFIHGPLDLDMIRDIDSGKKLQMKLFHMLVFQKLLVLILKLTM